MNRGNRKLGIVAGALLVLGYLIAFTPVFQAYSYYDALLGGNSDASPMAAAGWCNSAIGQSVQFGSDSATSTCGSANDWSTFGSLLLLVGAVLAVIAVVRYFRATAQTA